MKRAFAALSLIAMAGMAQGEIILIDYGDAAKAPTLGGTWNTIDSGLSGIGLLDTGGAATGVTANFAGDWLDASVDQGAWPSGNVDWVDASAVADYTFTTGDASVTFSGLTPGAQYRFDHVAARSLGVDRAGDYMVNGAFADSSPNGNDLFSIDAWNNGTILTWNSVTADTAGNITLTVTQVQSFAYVSASRIELVPAPGAGLALAIGGLATTRRRR